MDEVLTYETFKESYPSSKITEAEYKLLYKLSKDYILKRMAYSYEEVSETNKNDIRFYIGYQIDYFDEKGLVKSGVVSQSINGTSLSLNSENKQGDLNIANPIDLWLKNSGLCVRRL